MAEGRAQFSVSREVLKDGPESPMLVSLSGELDLSVADGVAAAIAPPSGERGAGAILVDLEDVTFIDSSVLHAVLGASEQLRDAGIPLIVIAGPDSRAARLFELAGVEDRLRRAESLEEARITLREGAR